MKPRTSMGHRKNSSLCVGFMVVSHSHGTIQVITCNDTGQDLEDTPTDMGAVALLLRRDEGRQTDTDDRKQSIF